MTKSKQRKQSQPPPETASEEDDLKQAFWSLRPDSEMQAMVERALDATGMKRQALIFRLIKESMPELVRKIMKERFDAFENFAKKDKD